jgi:hypothetical protein
MRCKEVEEMLSAFANDELSPSDRKIVEQHLESCANCREKLAGYTKVRERLVTLRTGVEAPDTKGLIMSRIRSANFTKKRQNIWKRRALVLVPASLILITILSIFLWNPWNGSKNIIAEAYSAISNVQSYRMSLTKGSSTEAPTIVYAAEFVAPDRYHLTQVIDGETLEFIYIGDEEYYKCNYRSFETMKFEADIFSSMITREATLRYLNMLGNIKQLPDETIEGIVCRHYEGRYDVEKQLLSQQEDRAQRGWTPFSKEDLAEMREEMHANYDPMKFELWIGKTDYLIRQWRISKAEHSNDGITISYSTYKFSDFNQPITIEAPLDFAGILLTGWVSTSPEKPAFSKDVQTDIDNYDPSSRRITYTVALRNISESTVNELDINILSTFTPRNNLVGLAMKWTGGLSSPKPWSLAPGESVEYKITFVYDATRAFPDDIIEYIENSALYIGYIDSDGQQKTELVHFTVPDSIYTLPTDTLPVYELKPVGEYRIQEPGASSASGSITGEIGGKKYLFVLVGTQNSDTPAEPGILILNIQNPVKPVKVSYLEAPEGAWFTMDSALSGTVFYVSTSDFLWIVDISNPAAPKELAKITGIYPDIVVSGNYAYLNDRNNRIIAMDVSDTAHPETIGSLELSSSSGISLDIAGNYLLVRVLDTLYTVDISSPSSMNIVNSHVFSFPVNSESDSPVSTTATTHVADHSIDGDYAYVCLTSDGKTGISIVDISMPSHPRELTFFELRNRKIWFQLFASGNRLFVFTRGDFDIGSGTQARLDIIDVSVPTNPNVIGYVRLPAYWSFFTNVQGNYSGSYSLIDKHLYWFIGNSPNQPVIEIFDLSKY